ncbi:MAG: phosphotransferase [Lysobacterales bacterium]
MSSDIPLPPNPGARLIGVVHPFNVDGLAGWMCAQVPGFSGYAGDLAIEQFHGGQSNPTYRISTGNGAAYILRRKPPGHLLPSAHAVEREYRVMQALAATDVPVPAMIGLCDNPDIIGTAF